MNPRQRGVILAGCLVLLLLGLFLAFEGVYSFGGGETGAMCIGYGYFEAFKLGPENVTLFHPL